jgi:AcrR family transcriptional regulator
VSTHSGTLTRMVKTPTLGSRRAAPMPPDERRSAIVEATLPLLLEHGEMVSTRQIAEAAGIAEGTIFRVFADKDAVIAAVVETALDTEPLEHALEAIDPGLSFEESLKEAVEILQRRVVHIWRVVSSVYAKAQDKTRRPVPDSEALIALFEAHQDRLKVEPTLAARYLRTLTLSVTHPLMVGEPIPADEVVELFLHGVSAKGSRC